MILKLIPDWHSKAIRDANYTRLFTLRLYIIIQSSRAQKEWEIRRKSFSKFKSFLSKHTKDCATLKLGQKEIDNFFNKV